MSEKLFLTNFQSPGDVVMMTAAIRDLHIAYPGKYLTNVETSCMELWEHNKYINKSFKKDGKGVRRLQLGYDEVINDSNEGSYSFIHGFHINLGKQLGIHIPCTKHYGYVPLSDEEKSWMSMIHEHYTKKDIPYWIIFSGGKKDYTSKWWIPEYAQEVVNHFKDKIQFVQCGHAEAGHYHPKLDHVIDLIGKTDLRMFVRLMYHAQGVVCPITLATHLSAAVETRSDHAPRRACVTICGGREPHMFIDYTNHQTLHTNGSLPCCDNGGCWKSRTVALGDGDSKDSELCIHTVEMFGRQVQKCMSMITPKKVIDSIEMFMEHPKRQWLSKEAHENA